jgi:hypothetical protein
MLLLFSDRGFVCVLGQEFARVTVYPLIFYWWRRLLCFVLLRRQTGVQQMRRTIVCVTLLTGTLYCPFVSAQTVLLTQTNRGSYDGAGVGPFGSGDIPNADYHVGDLRDPRGHECYPGCSDDYRNYLVFDMSTILQQITTAQLEMSVAGPGGGTLYSGAGFFSGDASENFELHDVITPIATLLDRSDKIGTHADLGNGVLYGSRTMTAADQGTVITIVLNSSAISALNAATGLFAMGGSLTTLDSFANYEMAFSSSGGAANVTRLRLTVVPEPSTLLLLGIGAISLLGRRKAKAHR